MRILICRDKNISATELETLQTKVTTFFEVSLEITPTFFVEEHDLSAVPTYTDSRGVVKPTRDWFEDLTDNIYKRYHEFGVDHIVPLVHEDHWVYDGIWGVNYSNFWHSYNVSLCRWDRDNMTNTFNTFVHEILHGFDAITKTNIGVNLHEMVRGWLGVDNFDWDRDVVHGNLNPPYGYIGRRAVDWQPKVVETLQYIKPVIQKAYNKRQALHDKRVGMMSQIIQLAQQYIVLARAVINKRKSI